MEIDKALDQVAGETKPGESGGGAAAEITGNEGSTDGNGSDLGVKEVPPELKGKEKELLRAFHLKTQELAEERKNLAQYEKDAKAFYGLTDQDWFKTAIEAEKARRQGRVTEISDEEFEAVKNDKRAFTDLLAKRDKDVAMRIQSEFKPELERLKSTQQQLAANRAEEAIAAKYGADYLDAKETGALDKYLERFDPETAFILHQQSQGKVAGKKPAAPAPDRRDAIVDKGGMSHTRGGPVSKAKDLESYLDRAFELSAKGVKNFRIDKE